MEKENKKTIEQIKAEMIARQKEWEETHSWDDFWGSLNEDIKNALGEKGKEEACSLFKSFGEVQLEVIDGCVLLQTSCGCPEQYEVFHEGEHCGFLRLRNGLFTVWDESQVSLIWESKTNSDGAFDWEERAFYLEKAVSKILEKCNSEFKSRTFKV